MLAYPEGGRLFIADSNHNRIVVTDLHSSESRHIIGGTASGFADGDHGLRDGARPLFYEPGGLDIVGERLYIADTNNHAVRVMDLSTGETFTIELKESRDY